MYLSVAESNIDGAQRFAPTVSEARPERHCSGRFDGRVDLSAGLADDTPSLMGFAMFMFDLAFGILAVLAATGAIGYWRRRHQEREAATEHPFAWSYQRSYTMPEPVPKLKPKLAALNGHRVEPR